MLWFRFWLSLTFLGSTLLFAAPPSPRAKRTAFQSPVLKKLRETHRARLLTLPETEQPLLTKTLKTLIQTTTSTSVPAEDDALELAMVLQLLEESASIHRWNPSVVQAFLIALAGKHHTLLVVHHLNAMPAERFTASVREALLEIIDNPDRDADTRGAALILLAGKLRTLHTRLLTQAQGAQPVPADEPAGELDARAQKTLAIALWPLVSPEWKTILSAFSPTGIKAPVIIGGLRDHALSQAQALQRELHRILGPKTVKKYFPRLPPTTTP